MKQCSECGAFSPDDTMFCAVCGKRFSDAIDVSSAENNNIEMTGIAEPISAGHHLNGSWSR